MCIRDSINGDQGLKVADGMRLDVSMPVYRLASDRPDPQAATFDEVLALWTPPLFQENAATAVSYTHLDVYKRQRQHRALLHWHGGGVGELVITDQTPAWAVTEARRRYGPLPLRRAADAELDGLLAAAYADAGDAASVVGAAENEVDLDRLLHEMPEITDLLDAQDDAPVIRMINALFTPVSYTHLDVYKRQAHDAGAAAPAARPARALA